MSSLFVNQRSIILEGETCTLNLPKKPLIKHSLEVSIKEELNYYAKILNAFDEEIKSFFPHDHSKFEKKEQDIRIAISTGFM